MVELELRDKLGEEVEGAHLGAARTPWGSHRSSGETSAIFHRFERSPGRPTGRPGRRTAARPADPAWQRPRQTGGPGSIRRRRCEERIGRRAESGVGRSHRRRPPGSRSRSVGAEPGAPRRRPRRDDPRGLPTCHRAVPPATITARAVRSQRQTRAAWWISASALPGQDAQRASRVFTGSGSARAICRARPAPPSRPERLAEGAFPCRDVRGEEARAISRLLIP